MTQTIGIARYRADQWEQLRGISADPDRLEKTYEEWLSYAKKQLAELRSKGCKVQKVDVDLDELLSWCTHKRLPLNGESRAQFVAHKLQQSEL
jgi:GTP cyclohydrolase I